MNFNVLVASDGTEGLVHVAENRSRIQLAITDLHMRTMDGITFVRAARRIVPNLRIVVTSGRLEDSDTAEFKSLGVTTFLDKPFTQQMLITILQKTLPG